MAAAPKMIMKAVKSVLVLLLVAGLLYGGLIVNQKRQEAISDLKQEALDEMAQAVDSFEAALLQNKEAVIGARDMGDWRDARAAWCRILASVEPEDLKLRNDEDLKTAGCHYGNIDADGNGGKEVVLYQYEVQRVDHWGTPYRIAVVIPVEEGLIETDVMIWSAGPNKEFFYAPSYMDGKQVPDNPKSPHDVVEPDDVCYTIVADKDFQFEYFEYKDRRSDNTSIYEFRPGA